MYELIVRRYNQRLFRVGMAILKNETEVEDAMQEAFAVSPSRQAAVEDVLWTLLNTKEFLYNH